MKQSEKVIAAIAIVVLLACGGLWAQWSASRVKPVSLNASEMEILARELLQSSQLEQLASNPEKRKEFATNLTKLFAIAQAAERQGYSERADVKAQIRLQMDLTLRDAYKRKHPNSTVTEEEIAEFYRSNPNAFDALLENSPQTRAQAQGAQRDAIKREYGELKVFADRGAKEGLEGEDRTRLLIAVKRSQVLASAYAAELGKKTDSQVTDEDVSSYYAGHLAEFEEVRARHILISTQPPETGDDDSAQDQASGKGAKGLGREEARKKAQGLLDRIKSGEDFGRLATENSDDPGSKAKGGDLGYFMRGENVRSFEDAAYSLPIGGVSGLVESEFGFHIIKVEDRRIAPLDTRIKTAISEKLKQERRERVTDEIVAKSQVQIAEDFNVGPK